MTLPCQSSRQISVYLAMQCSTGCSSKALGMVCDSVGKMMEVFGSMFVTSHDFNENLLRIHVHQNTIDI